MSRARNAGMLSLLAWLQCAQAYAFSPTNKCLQTHPTTLAEDRRMRAVRQPSITPLNSTPLNFTALNITASDCVEVARPPPSRGSFCNMIGPPDAVPDAAHVQNLVGACVVWQCSFDIYDCGRRANDREVEQYLITCIDREVEQHLITWCGALGCNDGPTTLWREQTYGPCLGAPTPTPTPALSPTSQDLEIRSSTVRAWVLADVRTALLEAPLEAVRSLEFFAAFLFPLNAGSGFVPFPPEFFAALLLCPLNGCSGVVPFPPWNIVVSEPSQALSVAFPTTFPVAVASAATSRVLWCTCWETVRTTEIKRAKKLSATGNSQDAKTANDIIVKCMDENVGWNRAICTIADVLPAVIVCATPLEWAHLPFYPSYELGLPMSPFELSISLELVVYCYLVKLDYKGDYGSGRPDEDFRQRLVAKTDPYEDRKQTTDARLDGENNEKNLI